MKKYLQTNSNNLMQQLMTNCGRKDKQRQTWRLQMFNRKSALQTWVSFCNFASAIYFMDVQYYVAGVFL